MANAALILYIWSIELLFFLSPESKLKYVLKQSQTSTGGMRALTMQRANGLPKLLSWRRTLQSWVRLSGIRKYSCHNLFKKCLSFMTNFVRSSRSFVLSDGQFVWNQQILVPIDLFIECNKKRYISNLFLKCIGRLIARELCFLRFCLSPFNHLCWSLRKL